MFQDYVSLAYKNIKNRKIRSFLTVLGIIISVMVIVTLLMISTGLQTAIEEQFSKIGANRVYITVPGGAPGTREGLTEDDVETLEKIKEVKMVTPYLFEQKTEMEYKNKKRFSNVLGWPTKDSREREKDYDMTFQAGRSFRDNEHHVAILGSLAAKELFFKKTDRRTLRVNNRIDINGVSFKIIGIYNSVGNREDDSQVYIPIDDAREIFDKPESVSFIEATLKDGVNVYRAKEKMERTLERKRDNDDFEIMTPEQILQFLNTALTLVKAILISIAAISLVVGAIGIMNSMYTAVMERTKEIGIMKSMGATNKQILYLFLVEAALIGLFGGIIGVFLGNLISFGISGMALAAGYALLKVKVDIVFIAIGLIFAFVVGAFSGALPARQAATLTPVDALRWIK